MINLENDIVMKNKSNVSSTVQTKAGSNTATKAPSTSSSATTADFGLQGHPAGNVSYGILLRLPVPSAEYFYNCRN